MLPLDPSGFVASAWTDIRVSTNRFVAVSGSDYWHLPNLHDCPAVSIFLNDHYTCLGHNPGQKWYNFITSGDLQWIFQAGLPVHLKETPPGGESSWVEGYAPKNQCFYIWTLLSHIHNLQPLALHSPLYLSTFRTKPDSWTKSQVS